MTDFHCCLLFSPEVPTKNGSLDSMEEDYGVKVCESVSNLLAVVCTPANGQLDQEL